MADNEQTVLKAMKKAGKPMRPADISKATGIDSKEVSKVIKDLKGKNKVHSPKRCFWAPVK